MKKFNLLLFVFLYIFSLPAYGQEICDMDDIKFIRVNVHFMLREAPFPPLNFTECDNGKGDDTYTGYDYAQELINHANDNWSKNYQSILFPGNTPPDFNVSKKVQLILQGVYFHRDNSLFFSFGQAVVGDTYGNNMGQVFNIFMMRNGTYNMPGGGYNIGGAQVASSAGDEFIFLKNGWRHYPSDSGSSCAPCPQWNLSNSRNYDMAKGLNHELGHIFGLCHSFGGNNPCASDFMGLPADIDPFQECNDTTDLGDPITGSCTGGGCHNFESGSNNNMGYNQLAHSMTPCQIQIMNQNIINNFSNYVELCCSEYTTNEISCNCAPNPNGGSALPLPGIFTTPECTPASVSICLPLNCPQDDPDNLIYPGEIDFKFVHENGDPDDVFSICEDVWLEGDFNEPHEGFYAAIFDVDDVGNTVWPPIAETNWWNNPEDPSMLNITQLFEDDVQFVAGNTYQVKFGIRYNNNCFFYAKQRFTYVDKYLDFYFAHEDGTEDETFALCEDVWLVSDFSLPYEGFYAAIFNVGNAGNTIWPPIAETSWWNNPEDPSMLNITELFGDEVEFIAGNTYDIKFGIKHADGCFSYLHNKFTYVDGVCCDYEPEVTFDLNGGDKCIVKVNIPGFEDGACNSIVRTYSSQWGNSIVTYDDTNYAEFVMLFHDLEICVSFCTEDCEGAEDICMSWTEEELLAICDDLLFLDPGPERPRGNSLGGNLQLRKPDNSIPAEQLNTPKDWVKLHPNPVADELFFESAKNTIEQISIFNTNYQIVKELDKINTEKGVLSMSSLPDGVYFIRFLNANNEIEIKKIVKIK